MLAHVKKDFLTFGGLSHHVKCRQAKQEIVEKLLSSLSSELEAGGEVAQDAHGRHNREEDAFHPILVLLHIDLTFTEVALHPLGIESTVLPIKKKHQLVATLGSRISPFLLT